MKIVGLVCLLLVGQSFAGGIYSYVDEDGVRVFTNLGASRLERPAQSVAKLDSIASHNFSPLIQTYASEYGVNQDLVEAIIKVESNFDPNAVSSKNCKGLMQLHPDTARRFGVDDVFDPAQNIEGGVKYLSYLMGFFDQELDHVLAAYNAGENAVVRHKGIPPYSETKNYVKKVKALYNPSDESASMRLAARQNRITRSVDENGLVVFSNAQ